MDNILYIGPYREFSGAGNTSRAYIKSLIKTGHNISVRPIFNIFKNYPIESTDQDIHELESNFSKKYHKVIQHCYPHQVCYHKNFDQNIAIISVDSFGQKIATTQYLEIADKIIVGSEFAKNELKDKIQTKICVIPEPVDYDKILQYKEINYKQNKDTFNFYCIADYLTRKNIDIIVLCFSKLAAYYDNIELVIKTKSYSGSDLDTKEELEFNLSKIYEILRNANLKKPKVVIGETSTEGIYYIHNNNDCIINISGAESFGYSVLESLAFQNNIICNKKIASAEIVAGGCGLLVDTESDMCLDEDRLFPTYNTTQQFLQKPIINSLIEQMEQAITETQTDKEIRQQNQAERVKQYTVDKVSEMFNLI
jgi:glycosyltransferase involved in cell wall biosynthesis